MQTAGIPGGRKGNALNNETNSWGRGSREMHREQQGDAREEDPSQGDGTPADAKLGFSVPPLVQSNELCMRRVKTTS